MTAFYFDHTFRTLPQALRAVGIVAGTTEPTAQEAGYYDRMLKAVGFYESLRWAVEHLYRSIGLQYADSHPAGYYPPVDQVPGFKPSVVSNVYRIGKAFKASVESAQAFLKNLALAENQDRCLGDIFERILDQTPSIQTAKEQATQHINKLVYALLELNNEIKTEPTKEPPVTSLRLKPAAVSGKDFRQLREYCQQYLTLTSDCETLPDDTVVLFSLNNQHAALSVELAKKFSEVYAELLKEPQPYKASTEEQVMFSEAASKARSVSLDGGKTWQSVNGHTPLAMLCGTDNRMVQFEDMDPELVQFEIVEVKQISYKRNEQAVFKVASPDGNVGLSEKDPKKGREALFEVLTEYRSFVHGLATNISLATSQHGDTMVRVENVSKELQQKQAYLEEFLLQYTDSGSPAKVMVVEQFVKALNLPDAMIDIFYEIKETSKKFSDAWDENHCARMAVFTKLQHNLTGHISQLLFILNFPDQQ